MRFIAAGGRADGPGVLAGIPESSINQSSNRSAQERYRPKAVVSPKSKGDQSGSAQGERYRPKQGVPKAGTHQSVQSRGNTNSRGNVNSIDRNVNSRGNDNPEASSRENQRARSRTLSAERRPESAILGGGEGGLGGYALSQPGTKRANKESGWGDE
jgi:hypothetical protein